MKKEVFRANSRGENKLDWLNSKFSFSFGDYYNPKRMGFGALRVINDDIITPNGGFPPHQHKDMEIITIVTSGELEHQDNLGNIESLTAGDVQTMSAGSGIIHSEFNKSSNHELKLFQIWIETKKVGINPSHSKKHFDYKENKITLVASGIKKGALPINQDASVYFGKIFKEKELTYEPSNLNGAFLMVIEGELEVEGEEIGARDAIQITNATKINIKGIENTEFILIEVPV